LEQKKPSHPAQRHYSLSGSSPPRRKPKPDEQSTNEQKMSKLTREIALKIEEIAMKTEEIASKIEEIASKDEQIASKDEEIAKLKAQRFKHSLKALVFEQMPLELANHGSKSSHTGQTKHMEAEMIETKIQLAPFTGKGFYGKNYRGSLGYAVNASTQLRR
jgi:hypothetical protein